MTRKARTGWENPTGAMAEVLTRQKAQVEAGEWLEGEMDCRLCWRPMRTRMIENPHGPGKVTPGSWYQWFTIGQHDPSPYVPMSICACCSFKTCPHRFPDCAICHHSTAPTGTYASGGPFVRCDGEASHPVEQPA